MTLIDIVTSALVQLGRTTDSQQQEQWRDKFAHIVNDGIVDMANALNLRRTDKVTVEDGEIDINKLPRRCRKIISVKKNGSTVSFTRGSSTVKYKVGAEGEVDVEYRFIPQALSSDTDEPELPNALHGLLVTFVCAREFQTGDYNTQRRANMYYAAYAQGKNEARRHYGEPEAYSIDNVRW